MPIGQIAKAPSSLINAIRHSVARTVTQRPNPSLNGRVRHPVAGAVTHGADPSQSVTRSLT